MIAHRVVYLCSAGAIACALFVFLGALTACGGGECDKSCDDIAAQAHGQQSIEPVHCAASEVCS